MLKKITITMRGYTPHEAMHKNRGYTQIVIGGLAYADCSHRIGVCELLYHEGHANQEAKRWGFFLPKLPVKLVEFKNEILIGINNKCYYIDSWKKDLWGKVVEKIKKLMKSKSLDINFGG